MRVLRTQWWYVSDNYIQPTLLTISCYDPPRTAPKNPHRSVYCAISHQFWAKYARNRIKQNKTTTRCSSTTSFIRFQLKLWALIVVQKNWFINRNSSLLEPQGRTRHFWVDNLILNYAISKSVITHRRSCGVLLLLLRDTVNLLFTVNFFDNLATAHQTVQCPGSKWDSG